MFENLMLPFDTQHSKILEAYTIWNKKNYLETITTPTNKKSYDNNYIAWVNTSPFGINPTQLPFIEAENQ